MFLEVERLWAFRAFGQTLNVILTVSKKRYIKRKLALGTLFFILAGPKSVLDDLMRRFQRIDWTCELILCLLAGRKCDLGEFDKVIFQCVSWSCASFSALFSPQIATCAMPRKRCFRVDRPYELIFCVLDRPKRDLGVV